MAKGDRMLETVKNYLVGFFQQYPVVVVIIVLVLLFIAYKNPKESFKFVIFLVIMACALYAVVLLSEAVGIGKSNKDQGINKTRKMIEE